MLHSERKQIKCMTTTLQEYDCVKCHEVHYSNYSEYIDHILHQSKHGLRTHDHRWIKTEEWGYNCWCGAYTNNP